MFRLINKSLIFLTLTFFSLLANSGSPLWSVTDSDFASYLEKAEGGDVDYQYHVGSIYYTVALQGNDDGKAIESAIYWISKAVEGGHVNAPVALGAMYLQGELVPLDIDKGESLYLLAAQSGHLLAQFYLGAFYAKGEILEEDHSKGLFWLLKARENGSQDAAKLLYILEEDISPEVNASQKLKRRQLTERKYYETQLESGDNNVKAILASLYRYGIGGPKREKEAYRIFEQLYKANNLYASVNLGRMNELGEAGLDVNYEKAEEYYREGVEQNKPRDHFYLGYLIERKLINKDSPDPKQRALIYYQKASDLGGSLAKCYLNELTNESESNTIANSEARYHKCRQKEIAKVGHPLD